jgi:hypothetical protein
MLGLGCLMMRLGVIRQGIGDLVKRSEDFLFLGNLSTFYLLIKSPIPCQITSKRIRKASSSTIWRQFLLKHHRQWIKTLGKTTLFNPNESPVKWNQKKQQKILILKSNLISIRECTLNVPLFVCSFPQKVVGGLALSACERRGTSWELMFFFIHQLWAVFPPFCARQRRISALQGRGGTFTFCLCSSPDKTNALLFFVGVSRRPLQKNVRGIGIKSGHMIEKINDAKIGEKNC